ncbi:O-antigen ligase family protein [Patiriisocius marinistellae]|uniref:O-antigen ligase family protein n=1 Tax=Patiriisocius marinistellae TaxID=2494560 RepID=UPI0015629892|nr:O-antigen ligase family protein [Patiriisocius marinistellae]
MPFLLIFAGGAFMNTNKDIGTIIKFSGFGYMIFYAIIHLKFNKNLITATSIFIPFLLYGIIISFNIKAGISDGLRYLFPLIILFYSYSIKKQFPILLKFVVFFVILNFVVQLVNYANWIRGVEQWFYYKRDGYTSFSQVAGILRGTGVVVFFGFYGFLNLISYIIISKYYKGKYKMLILSFAVFGILASISYKTVGTFLIILFIYHYKHFVKLLSGLLILALIIFISFAEEGLFFLENFMLRIKLYITGSRTARSESYRVMLEEIKSFNFFGEGVGTFGGPGSIKYNSPYYFEKSYKWYDAEWLNLITTDTYYPHPIVELGIIGGLVYLTSLCIPLLQKKISSRLAILALIYFAIFFDSLFSFSLNNPEFLMYSIVFAYPILHYYEKKD